MIITQEQLIREIAETENINLADLRRIFAGLEGLDLPLPVHGLPL